MIHPCDGQTDRVTVRQTDRQTDGIAMAYMRYSIYAVSRKKDTVHQLRAKKYVAWK